ncbi:YcjX family protein [Photobacterium sanguinicancri]|uniref:Nucleoside triphosphate hydrolase n=1 Tax=Photobacterium sanguinicancri TaxID=875932 RepID=A0AAW7Y2U5_9GAMM|nr:YcjX family protein [Photobacterium sanguinicancri]MDO6541159.1 YcjX family protein [Photobacterium sanguinicancri]OZS43508.1 nucleoside triphosphate hydrolase [Photobacterium sanguinicancri]
MNRIGNEFNKLVNRSLDRHVRLAVTGLSRAGKTAFITSLINQLMHVSTNPRLPLFTAVRDGHLLGAKRVPQLDLHVPKFAYDEGMNSLLATPSAWPEPTKDVSQTRLALRYKPQKGPMKLLQDTATLYLDIVDYPGEWLLDLPLLDMSFTEWSAQQAKLMKGQREALAQKWLALGAELDPFAPADEAQIEAISKAFTDYLYACKSEGGLHWVQPGRFVLPGELAGAPVLQFFPFAWLKHHSEAELAQADEHSNFAMLEQRYKYYQQHVVKAFYRDHFSKFDRQIILVDCLAPLNTGPESFNDMRQALDQLMQSFKYGRSSLMRRLFSPRIDKVLFAATKADHVTPEQHPNLVSLLQQMVNEAWQTASFEGIKMDCLSLSSIQATEPGFVSYHGQQMPALRGNDMDDQPQTIYPGEVPRRLPNDTYWEQNGFDFVNFRPLAQQSDEPLPHIRMDKALEYLLGDKLK